jgi:hypothetical protein
MEKAGGLFKSDGLANKGSERRAAAGNDDFGSSNQNTDSYGSGNQGSDSYGSGNNNNNNNY